MKIQSIQIQKFRSIDNANISFKQFLALVGANNVGKSHVLRALNAFFNFEDERGYFLNEAHLYSKQSRPKITITFSDITPEDEVDEEYICNQQLTIKFTYRWDRKNPTYEVIVGAERKAIDFDAFKRLIQHFSYVYIPIIRNYDAAFHSGTGIAYKLLYQVFSQQTANRNNLQPAADKLIKKVEASVYQPATKRLKQYYPFSKNQSFVMETHHADIIDLILRNVTLKLVEDSQENGIDNCGSGIQSDVFFAISLAISMNDQNNYLVGIEEPELNMHPQAQRQLIEALKEAERYTHTQFIVTTHSTVIIDRLGHDSIALCRKTKGLKRDVITSVTQIGDEFWNKYQMEEERYYNFFDFKNSDFFFSNYIIITESTNDCKVVQHLLDISKIDAEELGLSLIPANGERSVKYPYAIAKELGIPFVCIVDRDVFQYYVNDKRETSLNADGIPMYKDSLKAGSPILDLVLESDKNDLREAWNKEQYSKVLEILKKVNIISMRYAFEVDLVICQSYCDAFCSRLGVVEEENSAGYLLKNQGNAIKKYILINQVLDDKGTQNLPKSYKQILKVIREMIQ
mgnify:CR=1 FL=1